MHLQVKLACEYSKPMYLIEHKAHEDFVMILTKYLDRLPKCAIVDFTGTFEELEIYIDMGFYISITGRYTNLTTSLPWPCEGTHLNCPLLVGCNCWKMVWWFENACYEKSLLKIRDHWFCIDICILYVIRLFAECSYHILQIVKSHPVRHF